MPCAELVELVTDYLEGALTSEIQQQVDAHLSECPGCSEYVEQVRMTIRVAGSLRGEPEVDPQVRTRLVEIFRKHRGT
ncbi:MAG: zf-HC2 domain-containing protein [Gemmatimonadetes bacterium]|nr:zf-HC2 domain-containing protein [Gemmatimonadota bacterium]